MEIFERINEAITSDSKTVDVNIYDQDGTLKKISIPSFGYLKNEITRLDTNFSKLSGIGDTDTSVQLADGSFRKVLISSVKKPGNTLSSVGSPSEFKTKTNSFFEDFLNPLLFISVDVSGQIPEDTERISVKRYLLNLNTATKRRYWEDNYQGNSNIELNQFLSDSVMQNITSTEDSEVRDMPVRKTKYKGSFDILRLSDEDITETINDVEITRRRILYTVNKLTYTDDTLDISDTLELKIGDILLLNSEPYSTRYKVKSIDPSTLQIELVLVEGYVPIEIGTNILKIYRGIESDIEIQIPCGLDEYTISFFKPIDPVSKVIADEWSPGIGYYSNSLTLSIDGETQTLETYYKNKVADFGLFIKSFANDRIPPSVYAETPNTPEINSGNFKVVQINKHITNGKAFARLNSLHNQKNRLISTLKRRDVAIESMRGTLSTKRYLSTTERNNDKQALFSLIESRTADAEHFASVVRDITSASKNEDLVNVKAKFKIVGFWPMPQGKSSRFTTTQEVVQFKVQYRYVSNEGAANQPHQVSFNDNGISKAGSITNWIEMKTNPRKRIRGAEGKFYWEVEQVEDSDAINSNQLDIPDSLVQDDKVSDIVSQNEKDLVRVKLTDELTAQGISVHVSGSFTTNENYFAHPPTEISSGFLSAEQTPITLFDKLQEMSTKLEEFEALLQNIKGELVVKILDEKGVETNITNGSFSQFFAGYYDEEVEPLTIKKGAIISKTFFMVIENDAATPLELVGRISGDRTLKAYNSGGKFGDPVLAGTEHAFATDTYFIQRGKYDYVPILYTNADSTQVSLKDYINETPYQSSQKRNQFVYTKYKSVSGDEDFYVDFNVDNITSTVATVSDAEYEWSASISPASGNNADYVWNGDYDAGSNNVQVMALPSSTNYNNGIYIHKDHPDVSKGKRTTTHMRALARNSKASVLVSDAANGKSQTGYFKDGSAAALDPSTTTYNGGASGTTSVSGKGISNIGRTMKMAFEPNDQYLLGAKSVGSYLFLAPDDEDTLSVNGNDAVSLKSIDFGFTKAIITPIIFQYRMTDYKGVGNSGLGFVGGDRTETTQDITYAKRMGFDIKTSAAMNEAEFHFDIEIFA